jgi:Double zinc ribbon
MPSPGTPGSPPDWYAVLGLSPSAGGDEITAAVERMSRQATALSVTAPERSRQLRDQIRAIKQDLLAGDAQRQRYDADRARSIAPAAGHAAPTGYGAPASYAAPTGYAPPAYNRAPPASQQVQQVQQQFSGLVSRVARFLQTGWTCKSCGYGALPHDKFCQRCGTAIDSPTGPTGPAAGPTGSTGPAAGPTGPTGSTGSDPAGQGQMADAGQTAQPSSGASSFCGKCGGAITPGNTFCTRCGARH